MEVKFFASNGTLLSATDVVAEIIAFMRADERRQYKITIGTDSEASQNKVVDFVTAIVVHRVGNGGRYFWRRVKSARPMKTLRERILQEVVTSLDVAKAFLKTAETAGLVSNFDFEIHVDIGETGATKTMIQELVGMIRANNFEAKTKPYSYAASAVADRHVLSGSHLRR